MSRHWCCPARALLGPPDLVPKSWSSRGIGSGRDAVIEIDENGSRLAGRRQTPPRDVILRLPPLVIHVDAHRAEQHQALDPLLIVDADAEDGHAVVHHA